MPQDENGFELEESVALDDNGFEIAEAAPESVAQPKASPQIRGGEPSWRPPALVPPLGDIREAQKEIVRSGATPLFPIPHVSVPARPFGQAPTAVKAATGVVNSLADTASFFTSPLGISTLGMGMLPKAAQRVIAGVFAAHMASQMPEIATALGTELGKPESDRDAEKIANLTTTAATQLGFATLAGKHALTPTPKALRLAEEIRSAELSNVPTPDAAARRALALPPRAAPQALIPELERTRELVDRAIQEATQKIVVPGQTPALDLLRAQGRVIIPESIAAAERIQGGGQAPYGKLSYMRGAEAPTTERTQNALVKEAEQTVPSVRARDEIQQVPAEEGGPQIGVGGGKSGTMGRGGIAPSDASKITSAEKPMEPGTATGAEIPTAQVPTEKPPSSPETTPPPASEQAKRPERGLPESATESDLIADMTQKGRKFLADVKASPDEFTGFDAMDLPAADRRNLARLGVSFSLDRQNKVVGTWPRSKRVEALREKVQSAREQAPTTKPWTIRGEKFSQGDQIHWMSGGTWDGIVVDAIKNPSGKHDVTVRATNGETLTLKGAEDYGIAKGASRFITEENKPSYPGWESDYTDLQKPKSKSDDSISRLSEQSGLGAGAAPSTGKIAPAEKPVEPAPTTNAKSKSEELVVEPVVQKSLTTEPGKGALDTAIKNIEDLQKRIRGTGENLGMNVPRALLDTALEVARLTLKAGKTVTEAIEAAIAHIRKNASAEVKQGFDEAKTRDALTAALATPKATTPEPVAITAANVVPPAKPRQIAAKSGETLDDVYKIFEPVKKNRPKVGQVLSSMSESVRTGLASRFRPIDKLAEDIAAEYGVKTPRGIAGIFEQIKGASGKGEADIYRFDQEVSKPLRGKEKDFNAYMFLRRSLDRLRQDQYDIERAQAGEPVKRLNRRSVSDYTIPQLESKLAKLESDLGPENVATFEKAAEGYQQHMDAALKLQVQSGRMSPEVYAAIKDGNQFYAPFKVMKYLQDTSMPEGSGRRVDTLADYTKAMEGISDKDLRLGDMLGAARQNILLSRILAEKNRAMLNVSKLAEFDTNGKFIRRLERDQNVPLDMETVNVFENGKSVKYVVNKDVAAALQIYGQNAQNIILRIMGAIAVPFRAGATALNVPFQISNLLADQPRAALVSKYGVRGAMDAIRYPLDFSHALFSSIKGDMFGSKNQLFLDFLDSGVAGSTIQETLTPKSLNVKPYSLPRTVGRNVLWAIPDFAKAIEQTSKIMGVKRAMRFEGVSSGKELAAKVPAAVTELRRFSGSPDFGRQGKWTEQARLNILYMFFNARLQGTTADVGRLIGRDGASTAAKTWLKLGTAVGIPTVYLYLLNQDEEYADDYAKRPTQEKQNYWLIPKDSFITNADGEKIRDYWRIPKRESSKWIANMAESSLDFARKRDPESFGNFAQAMMEDISPVNVQGKTFQERLESTATSLNPLVKAPIELSSGRDMYRHKNIVPDTMKKASPEQQYTDRTAEVFKNLAKAIPDVAPEVFRSPLMLENLTKNLTAGLFTQFLPRKPVEGRTGIENSPMMQRFQSLPIVDRKAFDDELASLEREAADATLTRHRTAVKLMDENKGKSLEQIAAMANGDVKLIKHLVDLYVAKERGITGEERQLLGLPAQQRAAYIAKRINAADPTKKEQLIKDFASKRILTEAVAVELEPLLKP